MEKRIIGITGPIAAGKGTATAYLTEKYGAVSFRFSTSLFAIAELLGMPADRDHLSRISRILRAEFGEDALAIALAAQVEKSDASLIVVDGVRRPGDVVALSKLPGFRLVYIDAPMETRFSRMKTRGEKADDASKTYEEFLKDHDLESELLIADLQKDSQFVIDNSGGKDELFAKLDGVIA
jgi:dephospho-CoA kinase